jgi:hypothetical protein
MTLRSNGRRALSDRWQYRDHPKSKMPLRRPHLSSPALLGQRGARPCGQRDFNLRRLMRCSNAPSRIRFGVHAGQGSPPPRGRSSMTSVRAGAGSRRTCALSDLRDSAGRSPLVWSVRVRPSAAPIQYLCHPIRISGQRIEITGPWIPRDSRSSRVDIRAISVSFRYFQVLICEFLSVDAGYRADCPVRARRPEGSFRVRQ